MTPEAEARGADVAHDGDPLGLPKIVALLWRCLPWILHLRGHLGLLLLGWALVGGTTLVLAVTFVIVLWNSLLGDAPLSPFQAALFGQDPALAVHVEALGPPLRHALAERWTLLGALGVPVLVATSAGLVYYQIWILQRINQLLRLEMVDRLQSLSLRFHAESRIGDAIYRTYQDSAMVTQLIEVMLVTPLASLARYAAGLLGVALYHPFLALLLTAIWGPALWLGWVVSWRLRARFRRARETNSALTSRIQETLAGMRVIKAYGLERRFQELFESDSTAAFERAFRARSLFAALQIWVFWIVSAAGLSAAAFGIVWTVAGQPTFLAAVAAWTGGSLQAAVAGYGFLVWNLGLYNGFTTLFGNGNGAVQRLYATWGRTQDIAIGLDRSFELLDLEPEIRDRPGAVDLQGVREAIRFEGVSFAYEPGRPTLRDVSLVAEPGTVTAVVGPTGSGKTTLVALLLRLFDPDEGCVRIDGLDLRDLQVDSLRRQVAIALQENVLFGTTVRENIRYAVPTADEARVREAARVACAEEFIERLPDGYDTLLGERGTKLSTGQRQRLSIARAVLKDAPILILDEPTAALDAETELRLLDRLEAWGRGRVIFLITHRLSTIRRADRIAVLERGRLVEHGSHAELMARSAGVYRSLVESETDEAA